MIKVGARGDVSRSVVRNEFPEFATAEAWDLYPQVVKRDLRKYETTELAAALRSMVLCEAELPVPGGSPSYVKWVFREIADRDRDAANQIAGWVVDNRGNNPYIPWGTSRFREARSFEEREQAERALADQKRRKEAQQAERKRARAEQRRSEAALRREGRERAASVRKARISELIARPDIDCLQEVIASKETLDYWPPEISEKCRRALPACTVAEFQLLLPKVRAARSDHWRALRQPIRDAAASQSSALPATDHRKPTKT
jgi:hypothetical protein